MAESDPPNRTYGPINTLEGAVSLAGEVTNDLNRVLNSRRISEFALGSYLARYWGSKPNVAARRVGNCTNAPYIGRILFDCDMHPIKKLGVTFSDVYAALGVLPRVREHTQLRLGTISELFTLPDSVVVPYVPPVVQAKLGGPLGTIMKYGGLHRPAGKDTAPAGE